MPPLTGVPLIVVATFAGLLIGSFLNVCVFRLPRDLSVAHPRSFCPGCEKMIAWYDNIPLLSFFLLKGRCRYCHDSIPWRYPLVEICTAITFGLCSAAFGWSLASVKYAVLSAILIELIASDAECRILPDEFTKGGVVLGIVFSYFVPVSPFLVSYLVPMSYQPRWHWVAESVSSSLIVGGLLWLTAFVYEKVRHREGMGLGDIKMIAMIGAFLGLGASLLTLMAASMLGAIGGIVYVKTTGKDMSTYELPFGSFLGAVALVLMLVTEVWPALHG
jgi:leader peptidase (prepilin peptidase) / N-methyltransferase